jgi:hypothetical protein
MTKQTLTLVVCLWHLALSSVVSCTSIVTIDQGHFGPPLSDWKPRVQRTTAEQQFLTSWASHSASFLSSRPYTKNQRSNPEVARAGTASLPTGAAARWTHAARLARPILRCDCCAIRYSASRRHHRKLIPWRLAFENRRQISRARCVSRRTPSSATRTLGCVCCSASIAATSGTSLPSRTPRLHRKPPHASSSVPSPTSRLVGAHP